MKNSPHCLLILVVLPAILLLTTQLQAQNWAVSAGWAASYIGDQHTSPLLYRSDALQVGGQYNFSGESRFEIGLQIQIGTNQAQRHRRREGTFYEIPSLFEPQESYDYVVNPFFSRLGGRFFARLHWPIGEYSQLGIKAQVRYDLAGMAGDTWKFAQAHLGPSYRYKRPLHSTGSLHFSAHLPLIATVVRPNWAVDASLPDETNYFKGYLRTSTRLTSLHDLQNPQVQLGYQYQLQRGKALRLDYQLEWLSYSQPRPLRMFEHGLRLSYLL